MVKEQGRSFEGFDRLFPIIGGHHTYQWLLLAALSFQRGIVVLHNLGYVFLGATPEHWCQVESLSNSNCNWTEYQIKNLSIPFDGVSFAKCEYYDLDYQTLMELHPNFEDAYSSIRTEFGGGTTDTTLRPEKKCDKWIYDKSMYESTTVTEFDLVCHRRHLVATIQGAYMVGIFIGSLVLGAVSDKLLGRKGTTLLANFLVIAFGFGNAFVKSYPLFLLCRLIVAIGIAGTQQCCFTLLMEYSDVTIRATFGMITQLSFAFGYMATPLYAYYIRDWVNLQLAFSVSTLTLISCIWILPESSRWLAQQRREDEAIVILQKIAKVNRKPKPNVQEMKEILIACQCQNDSNNPQQPSGTGTDGDSPSPKSNTRFQRFLSITKRFLSSYLSLVRTPELRKRSFLIWFLYIASAFSYYGVSFGSIDLSDDPFLMVFLGGLMEIPAYLGVIPFVSYWGRMPTAVLTFLLAGFSYLAIVVVPIELSLVRITLAMISKIFISAALGIVILVASEIYPTEARSTGLGSAILFGRFGAISAPYVVNIKFTFEYTSHLIIGGLALLSGFMSFLLPETKEEELLENVSEIENAAAAVRKRRASREYSTAGNTGTGTTNVGAVGAGEVMLNGLQEEPIRLK